MIVDHSKAFDHVDHSILLAKLISLDVPAYTIKWMYFFYLDKRQQSAKIGCIFSSCLLLNGSRYLVGPSDFCHSDRWTKVGLSDA